MPLLLIFTGFNNIARVESFQKDFWSLFSAVRALLHSTPWLLIIFIKYSMNSFRCLLVSIIRRDMGASNCRRKCSSGTYGPRWISHVKNQFSSTDCPVWALCMSRADDPALISTGCGRAGTRRYRAEWNVQLQLHPRKQEEEERNQLRHFRQFKTAIKIFEELFPFGLLLGSKNMLDTARSSSDKQ